MKKALKEGFIDKEKKGRKVFYWITEEGKDHLISNQDQLDDARIWLEDPVFGGYLSYAIAPKGTPLICETRDEDSPSGKDKIRELMKLIKEENPDLETIKIRFDSTDDSFTD